MKRIRYLTTMLMLLLAGSTSLWAQDDTFNPADPPEPGQPPMKLQITVSPAEAGSVSGTGLYAAGTKVSLRAYVNTGFRFIGWADAKGNTLSTSTAFTYTKGEGHEHLWANYEFDPTAPDDPADPATIMYYQLQVNATEGGYASGGGRYLANKRITLSASTENQFNFVGWYDDATGELLSSSRSFTYTTTAHHRSLTARFQFNPDNPVEPSTPVLSRVVTATATEGGTVNYSSQRALIGSSITISASRNTGYDFLGWYLRGELYTKLSSFSYKVTDAYDQHFEARFEFNPDSPNDPGMPTTTKHAFFLMNKVTKPGATVQYPIYLSNVRPLGDMTFQLTFPQELPPNLESVSMSERAKGYTVSATQQNDTTYVVSFIGGEVPVGNATVLAFSIPIPADIITGKGYQVKINQVTVTEADGTVTTASTRNGRISVYKNGDANGDDEVNIVDVTSTISAVLGQTPDDFISEAADTNDDEEINIVDVTSTIDIVLGGSGVASRTALAKRKESAQEGNRLTAADVTVNPGGKTTLTIGAAFEKTDFIGYQLDITLPKGLSLQAGADGRPAATSLTVLDVIGSVYASTAESTTYRFVASKMGNPVIPAGSYALLSVTILADESLAAGDVLSGALSAIKFSDATQHGTDLADVSFSIAISNEVVLDENSTTLPEAAEGVDVRVLRTIAAGSWSTLVLPFAMTEAQVQAAFGSDVQIGDFAGTEPEFDDDDRVVGITVNFDDVTSIEANHPYIIKVQEAVEEFTVSGVDIDADEDGAFVEFDNGRTGSRRVVYSGFYGTYHAGAVLQEFTLFLSDNKFWYSAGQTKMKAFRAYFDFLDVLTDVEEGGYGARIALHYGSDGEASGVRSVAIESRQSQGIYDLQGRRVAKAPRKGLYIKNGQKMVVK